MTRGIAFKGVLLVFGYCYLSHFLLSGELLAADSASRERMEELFKLSLEELSQVEVTHLNVLGSHTHFQGEWMIGYRYMFMNMGGNLDGTREVSTAEVLQTYPVVHTSMTMEMHMLEVMYAPSDKLTLMVMGHYARNSMDHLRTNGTTFSTESEGFGDASLMALYNVLGDPRKPGHRLLLNAGLSLPSGSIDERHAGMRLEYPMQLGSGTVDFMPGLTYLGQLGDWAWGAQALGTVRVGKNGDGYRLGDNYRLNTWGHYKLTDWIGPSLRVDWHDWENIHGIDLQQNPATNPAFDPTKQRGRRLDLLMGLNFYAPRGILKGHRLNIEGGLPVYQSLAGPNLKTDWLITVGWSYSFH